MKQNVDEPLLLSQTVTDTWFDAIEYGDLKVIQQYRSTYHIPINELTNVCDKCSLMVAIEYNHLEIVIILLKNYANPLSQDKFGKTPSQITKNDVIIYYLKRVKVLYILYKNISIQSFYEKVKCGVDYVFAHEMVRIGKEKILKIKKD